MSQQTSNLTIEQQFAVASARQQIADLSAEQLREAFIELYVQMFAQNNACCALVADAWGIDRGDSRV